MAREEDHLTARGAVHCVAASNIEFTVQHVKRFIVSPMNVKWRPQPGRTVRRYTLYTAIGIAAVQHHIHADAECLERPRTRGRNDDRSSRTSGRGRRIERVSFS